MRKIDISLGVKPQPWDYCDLQVVSCLCSLRVSHLPWDRHTTASDPNAVFSLSSHQEHIESRRESADLVPVFKKRCWALPPRPQSTNGAMIPVFDPPSPTTRCGGLWGQVRCKQIQYTLHCTAPQGSQWSYSRGTNHSRSQFACFFLLYFPSAHASHSENAAQPPTAAIIWFIYIWTSQIDWMGPFLG